MSVFKQNSWILAVVVLLSIVVIMASQTGKAREEDMKTPSKSAEKTESQAVTEKAVFAAGCFWHVQADFDRTPGVISTRVGYTGGKVEKPTYRQVCSEATGHAEAIEITYDPGKVAYEKLLNTFWHLHDPTTLNRQGPDVGSQYRSAVFYTSPEQKQIAESLKEKLQASGKYKKDIVTQIAEANDFYPAEDYHQKYFEKNGLVACTVPMESEEMKKEPKTEAEWKKLLTKEQYNILRKKGTERAFTGEYDKFYEQGLYKCAGCGNTLFDSDTKFDSGCGWPSFYQPIGEKNIDEHEDRSLGMNRTEVTCSRCGGHLGHVFDDGPKPTNLRYCINSASLKFEEEKEEE
jgi:peptide methionine sulfoxide reductase msrA/msrB